MSFLFVAFTYQPVHLASEFIYFISSLTVDHDIGGTLPDVSYV